jgi:type II secretory pathway component GspD/PulD (secretin)
MKRCAFVLVLALWGTSPALAQGLLSIDARDTELGDVLRLIGAQAGWNIVPDASIKPQHITFRLRDVDAQTALTTLAHAYNLQIHRDGPVLLVGDAATMNRRYLDDDVPAGAQTSVFPLTHAHPEDVAQALLAALPQGTVAVADKRTASVIVTATGEAMPRVRRIVAALDGGATGSPVSSEAIPLHNERPSDIAKTLKTAIPDAAIVPDDRANSVVVSGSGDARTTARSVLAGLDRPGRQVMFEVKVTDVKPNDDSSNVGFEFGGTSFGAGALAQFPYTIAKSSVVVNAQLNTLVQRGRAQILATPRIATLNNVEASMLVGEQYPVVTVNQQTGYPSVQTIDVGVQLRVTPTIGDDDVITADLHPSYSQIIGFNSNFPIIANRKVDSTLRVHDGETIVLGGLFEDTTSETLTKLPWLGDLPILGGFFRNKATTHERDEVVFFITPHILALPSAPP